MCDLLTLPVIRMTGRENEAVQAALLAAKYRASRAAKLASPVHPAREVEKPGSSSLSKSGIGAGLWTSLVTTQISLMRSLSLCDPSIHGISLSNKGTHHFPTI